MENSIGKRIATLRKQNGWSQVELASMLNVSDKSVSKWENGGMPGIDLLPKLSKIFNTSIDYLLLGDGDDSNNEETEEAIQDNLNINGLSLDDINLILKDQRDLYNDEEWNQLLSRRDELMNPPQCEDTEEYDDDDDWEEDDPADKSDSLGCWAYIVAFFLPLIGFIIGLVYRKSGLILFSVILMALSIILAVLGFFPVLFEAFQWI